MWTARIVIVCFAGAVPAFAQDDAAKFEVFGGYTYFNADSFPDRIHLHGWSVSLERYLNRRFALSADFDGAYGSENGERVSGHSAMFGGKVVAGKRFRPFGNAVFGVVREHEAGVTEYGFGMNLGGGVDYELNRLMSLRPAQAGYEFSRVDATNHHSFRFVAGVVLKFGELK
jgi:hypothetical protein